MCQSISANPLRFVYVPERPKANFLPALHHWCQTPLSGALIVLHVTLTLAVALNVARSVAMRAKDSYEYSQESKMLPLAYN